LEKAKHYASALLKWRKAGYPVRTDDEIAKIVEICHSCERFNHDKQVCGICGCKVSLRGWAVKNKAALQTEHCSLPNPDKKW